MFSEKVITFVTTYYAESVSLFSKDESGKFTKERIGRHYLASYPLFGI
jgi:hypothetical protein